jgi:hypothetical protein
MADKLVAITDVEEQQIEAIVIDKDKEEALRFLAQLVERLKGHAGHVCGPGPIK